MIVRPEADEDRAASVQVEIIAFDGPDEAAIVEAVRDLPGSFALVAETEGEVVGHVQVSQAWVGSDAIVALGPIGVLPRYRRRGVASALIAASLEEVRRRGWCAMILLGDPGFYGERGFEPAAKLGLRNPFTGVQPDGFEIHEEDMQIAVLDPIRASKLTGDVRWHPAFG